VNTSIFVLIELLACANGMNNQGSNIYFSPSCYCLSLSKS
jgi:hypothetical protein